ncbi:MAG TPA: response regulator transcription factor [Armatimonadetes bacterium]|nr:response regulator transcription factor [Armatimonadota bacterium]
MKRILVVDDDEHVLKVCRDVLATAGYTVVTASNGREALERLRRESFDLAIVDLMMPVMNGYELLRALREEISSDLPVAILTGYGSFESCLRCARYGVAAYLSKPFRVNALRREVAAILGDPHRRVPDPEEALREKLTPREKEVLLEMRKGLTDVEIAQRLFISPHTARNHVKRIIEKLNVRNRAEAIALSYREDLFAD